jgi:hypothetical protein
VKAFLIKKVPAKGRESVMTTGSELSAGARLYALLAAIKRSPIVLRLTERLLLARAWASVRKSPDVDAYVLAWIASRRRPTPAAPVYVNSSPITPPTQEAGDVVGEQAAH